MALLMVQKKLSQGYNIQFWNNQVDMFTLAIPIRHLDD